VRRVVRIMLAGSAVLLVGCTHKVQVEPIKVEPIHVTLDIHLKVDRELERFFEFENKFEPETDPAPGEPAPMTEGSLP
jgi:hypothetical protein